MQSSNSTEFSAKDGRGFAFPVGTAFLVLAGVLYWRDRNTLALIVASLGGVLWLFGILIPGRLGPIYRGWMQMALAISKVTTPIFMGIVYFGVMMPTGLIMRALGRRPIEHQRDAGSYWQRAEGSGKSDLQRQF